MLVIVLHAKHLPMDSGIHKRLVRLQTWLRILLCHELLSY